MTEEVHPNEQFVDPYGTKPDRELIVKTLIAVEEIHRAMEKMILEHIALKEKVEGPPHKPSGDKVIDEIHQLIGNDAIKVCKRRSDGVIEVYLVYSKNREAFSDRMRALNDRFGKDNVSWHGKLPDGTSLKSQSHVEVKGQ